MQIVSNNPELVEKIRQAYERCHNVTEVSREFDIGHSTVRRYAMDLIEEHNENTRKEQVAFDQQVITWRRHARATGERDVRRYMEESGKGYSTITKAVTGATHRHLNAIEPPVILQVKESVKQQQARELYLEGYSFNQITKKLKCAKSSVSLWCKDLVTKRRKKHVSRQDINDKKEEARRLYQQSNWTILEVAKRINVSKSAVQRWCEDLVEVKYEQGLTNRKPRKKKRKNNIDKPITSQRRLTDEQVIEIRATMHETGTRNLNYHAEKHNVHFSCVSCAASGKTFRHLNEKYPPVTKKLPLFGHSEVGPKVKQNEDMIQEAMELRRSDPAKWSYDKIAQWLSEKTGKKYRSNHINILFNRRDISFRELEKLYPSASSLKVKKDTPKPVKLTPQQLRAKAIAAAARRIQKKREEEAAIAKLIAEEDAREQALIIKASVTGVSIEELASEYA